MGSTTYPVKDTTITCPEPTTFTHESKTYVVTKAPVLTFPADPTYPPKTPEQSQQSPTQPQAPKVKQLGHQNDHLPKTGAKMPANKMGEGSKKVSWALSKAEQPNAEHGGLKGDAQNLELQQEDVWAVEAIIDEDQRRYKIRWAGVDDTTGEKWPDSWEPKKNVGLAVIKEWKERNGRAEQAATGRR